MKSLISVIVPIYNSKQFLNKCIDSLLNQTITNLDIILVDDGSTDGSAKICDEYARRNKQVRVIHKHNAGQAMARLDGLHMSNSKYVGFVDSDDWVEPNQFQRMLEVMDGNGVDMVLCNQFIDQGETCKLFRNQIKAGFYDKERIKKEVYPKIIGDGSFFQWNIYPSLCNRLFIREKLIPFQKKADKRIVMGEDAAVSIPYMISCDSFYVLDEAYYHYVQHMGSTVRLKQDAHQDIARYRCLYNWLYTILRPYIMEASLIRQLRDYILFIAVPRIMDLTEEYQELEILLPFEGVRKGSRVILYGAGIFGLNMYRFLRDTNFCFLVDIVDKEYRFYQTQQFQVSAPEVIKKIDQSQYDAILVTVMDVNTQQIIRETLLSYGVEKTCIKTVETSQMHMWLERVILSE